MLIFSSVAAVSFIILVGENMNCKRFSETKLRWVKAVGVVLHGLVFIH